MNRYNDIEPDVDEVFESDTHDNDVYQDAYIESSWDKEKKMQMIDELRRKDCAKISKNANVMLYVLFLLFTIVLIKILILQFTEKGADLRDKALDINYKYETIPAKRGNIISANGSIISSTVDMYKVFMDLRSEKGRLPDSIFYDNYEALADSLSSLFGDASATTYRARLLEWRKKEFGNKLISPPGEMIDYNQLNRLKKFPILNRNPERGGAKVTKHYIRKNYYGGLAQRTLGRAETETARGYGIERSFDNYLRGEEGKRYMRKVAGSLWMPSHGGEDVEPKNGLDVVTTIDANIQDVAENTLREYIEENSALSGTAVVMEVSTGHIRAMANLGRNRKGELIEDYNHAIANNVEPGSTFKLATLIALLEDTPATINTEVDTKKGKDVVNGTRVSDSERNGYGVIPLKTCMSKSSNIGFARLVDDYFREKPGEFIASIHKLGITKPFDFQILGERAPIMKSDTVRGWSKADLVTMSYGYASNFTALRILMLYNAIGNGGKLITPLIVSEVRENNKVIERYQSEVLNPKICSDETLREVKIALEDVMFDGTVRNVFKGENYVVAGKTGTSRQVGENGRYESEDGIYYLSSFVGYFPANEPKYSCIVQIRTFKPYGVTRNYYGSSLAAPVFKNISHYLSTQDDWGRRARDYAGTKERELAKAIQRDIDRGEIKGQSSLKRLTADYSDMDDIDYNKVPINVIGKEDEVIELIDAFGLSNSNLKFNNTIDSEGDPDRMPSVIGMGLNDAMLTLEDAGLKVTVKGFGKVYKQSIKAGAKISRGNKVIITLRK